MRKDGFQQGVKLSFYNAKLLEVGMSELISMVTVAKNTKAINFLKTLLVKKRTKKNSLCTL